MLLDRRRRRRCTWAWDVPKRPRADRVHAPEDLALMTRTAALTTAAAAARAAPLVMRAIAAALMPRWIAEATRKHLH